MASLFGGRTSGGRRERAGPPATSDEALVRSLYAEHGRMLLGYVFRLTNDRQLAEDIVQETLVRAWRHADSLSAERGSVRSWLFTVARNITTDKIRAKRARPAEVDQELADSTAATVVTRDHAEDVTNSIVVKDALDSLSPEHRDVLVEVYFRGKTVAEAGEALGVPPGTVKSRTYYALRSLRNTLGQAKEVTA